MCFFAKTEEALHVSLKVLESPETYPGLPSRPDAKVLLRIWRYAAHLQSCYIVSECPDGLFLRRLTRTNLTNDFYGSETPLEQGGFARLSAELDKIHIPPFLISESFGLDGTTCGIEKERFAGKAKGWNGGTRQRRGAIFRNGMRGLWKFLNPLCPGTLQPNRRATRVDPHCATIVKSIGYAVTSR